MTNIIQDLKKSVRKETESSIYLELCSFIRGQVRGNKSKEDILTNLYKKIKKWDNITK